MGIFLMIDVGTRALTSKY